MKRLILFVLLFSPMISAEAQILNAGFESWTAGNPDNWFANNAASLYVPVTQSTDVHGGSSSAKGTVVSFSTEAVSPNLISGTGGRGFAAGAHYGSVTGYYKFAPVSGDSFTAFVVMYKNKVGIGIGEWGVSSAENSYTKFTIPITYYSSGIPDTAFIQFTIEAGSGQTATHVGSAFTLDDLAYGPVTSVNDTKLSMPASYTLAQNFPNPFNPSTTISFGLPQKSLVRITIVNALGEVVAKLVDAEMEAAAYSVVWNANVASGIYFYRMEAVAQADPGQRFTETKKMLLLR